MYGGGRASVREGKKLKYTPQSGNLARMYSMEQLKFNKAFLGCDKGFNHVLPQILVIKFRRGAEEGVPGQFNVP